jgi:hypothetical protein
MGHKPASLEKSEIIEDVVGNKSYRSITPWLSWWNKKGEAGDGCSCINAFEVAEVEFEVAEEALG